MATPGRRNRRAFGSVGQTLNMELRDGLSIGDGTALVMDTIRS